MTDSSLTESLLSNVKGDAIESKAASRSPLLSVDPVPVPEEYESDNVQDPESSVSSSWERGEEQAAQWRDLPFGILFYGQCISVLVLAAKYGIPTVQHDFQTDKIHLTGSGKPLYSVLIAIASATVFTILALAIVVRKAKSFISCSIISNIVFNFMCGIVALAVGNVLVGGVLLFFGMIGLCYFFSVRRRIPFAAANLQAGANAVRDNGGIVVLAYFWGVLFIGWFSLWSALLYSTGRNGSVDVCTNDGSCHTAMNDSAKAYITLLVLSFYWTVQVSNNVVHTTVAGVVGTWYFEPSEASWFCSDAICASTLRTLTFSFGSVCFGSLICAIISTLRFLLSTRNRNNDTAAGSILYCLLDCVLSLVESIMQYFNKWAFIYVGLYGYPYITAGKKVTTLFQQRGWSVFINDELVARVLNYTSTTVGLLCGIVQYLIFSDWYLFG